MLKKFENKIIECINSEDFPLEVKRLIMLDILNQIETILDRQIAKECEELKRKEEENEQDI